MSRPSCVSSLVARFWWFVCVPVTLARESVRFWTARATFVASLALSHIVSCRCFLRSARRKIRMLQQDWGVESAGVRNVPSWGFSALSWGLGAPPGGCGPRLTVPPWPLDSSPFSPCADVKRLIVFAAPLEGSLMFAGPALRRVRSSSSPPCAFPCVVVITELGRHGISRRDNTESADHSCN